MRLKCNLIQSDLQIDMDKEKIISTISGKVGNTDVSPKTIEMLIGLNPIAEGTEPDDAYFTKMADAVKSIQGNVNHVFSEKLTAQVNAKVEELKSKQTTEADTGKNKGADAGNSELLSRLEKLEKDLNEERTARQNEKLERSKKDVMASVKKGLEDKFEQAGMKLNGYFLRQSMSRLEIPDSGADIKALITKAESLYNEDLKEAGYSAIDAPRSGGGAKGNNEKQDFADVAKIIGRNRPSKQTTNN